MSESAAFLFLGAVMAVVVGLLLRQTLSVRPWTVEGIGEAPPETGFTSVKIGLWVFLAVVTSLFALFISAYSMRMTAGDWEPLPEPALLWLNTAVLILTSVVMQWTVVAAKRANRDSVRTGLNAAGALTFAFLAGQLAVWQQLSASGFLLVANPANAFFYLLTALHGLHLVGGLVAWGRTVARVRGGANLGEIRLHVGLCAAYWHYLLLIWLVLFALLLST